MIENLNKAYYPSKTKKGRKCEKKKKKSSTPNIKARVFPKDYVPVLQQFGYATNDELDELENLKNQKLREEQDILMNQK